MLIEFGLGDANCGVEIVVGQMGIEDFVAVLLQIGRLQAAWSGLPAVEEKDGREGPPLNVRSQGVGGRVGLFAYQQCFNRIAGLFNPSRIIERFERRVVGS